MSTTTLTSKGQLTLPKHIRTLLNLHSGDKLEVFPQEDGSILLQPATVDISDLCGLLPPPERAVSLKEMESAIEQGANE